MAQNDLEEVIITAKNKDEDELAFQFFLAKGIPSSMENNSSVNSYNRSGKENTSIATDSAKISSPMSSACFGGDAHFKSQDSAVESSIENISSLTPRSVAASSAFSDCFIDSD